MPDPKPTDAPSTPGSGVPPTSPTPGSEPAGAQSTGFRFTAEPGVPDFLVGKTAKEAAQYSAFMYDALKRRNAAFGQPPPAYQQDFARQYGPQAPSVPSAPTQPSQDDWQLDPKGAMDKYAEYLRLTQLEPFQARMGQTLAEQSRTFVRDRYSKEFSKWGPEIEVLIDQLSPDAQTINALDTVVQMVRARHVDELAEERVSERLKELIDKGSVIRSGDAQAVAPSTPSTLDLDIAAMPENYREVLSRYRIDGAKVDEFLGGQAGSLYGATLEERRKKFMELAKNGDIFTEERFKVGNV